MAKVLRFVGGPSFKPGHAYPTPPLVGPVKFRPLLDPYTGQQAIDINGRPALEEVKGWEVGDEVVFDRSLAEQHGRVSQTNEKDDGEEWAEMHAAFYNDRFPEGQKPFEVRSVKAKKTEKE